MKLYLGSRDYLVEGYQTVDCDPTVRPDIVSDVRELTFAADETVDEICASHVLEHLPWPTSFAALAEWMRVLRYGGRLRIAVPDVALLAKMILERRNEFHAMALLFGVGRIENALEGHAYGYTSDMLISILGVLGFDDFEWWHHDIPDASTGWFYDLDGARISLSLNIAATRKNPPLVEPAAVYEMLLAERMRPFDQVIADYMVKNALAVNQPPRAWETLFLHQMHWQLIEARQRILYLEEQITIQGMNALRNE